jgi:hypothetical protein
MAHRVSCAVLEKSPFLQGFRRGSGMAHRRLWEDVRATESPAGTTKMKTDMNRNNRSHEDPEHFEILYRSSPG